MLRFKSTHRIFIISFFIIGFHVGFGQEDAILSKRVTLQLQNQTVEEAIETLEKETGYSFSYASSSVDNGVTLSKNFNKRTIEEILKIIFSGYEVTYIESGGVVLIKISGKKQKKDLGFGQIKGRVIDASKNPIAFATVAFKGTQKGVFTDVEGKFSLTNVPAGSQTLQVSYTGFKTKETKLQVVETKTVNSTIQLVEVVNQLEEVVVVGETEKAKLENTAQAIRVVEMKEAQLKTPDLGEVLARTEGVAIQRAGGLGSGTRISLNGLTDDQIRIFIDGIPLESAGYTFDIANVPVSLLDHVEVYKGVVPIRFGADALGGAINLVTPRITQEFSGSLSYQIGSFGTHRVSVNMNRGNNKTGLFFKGSGFYDLARNNYTIQVSVPDELGRPFETTIPRFHDRYQAYGATITLGINERLWADELSLTGYLVDNQREIQSNAVQSGLPYGEPETSGEVLGVNLSYKKYFGDSLSLSIVSGYARTARSFVDLSNCRYNWFGECFLEVPNRGEVTSNGADRTNWDDNLFARLNAEWIINSQHLLRLTTAPTIAYRTGDDAVIIQGTDIFEIDADLLTWINGFEYQFNFSDRRIENRFFVKNYQQKGSFLGPNRRISERVESNTLIDLWGLGNVTRIKLTNQITTKLSYEWTTRLPRRDELFGNGVDVIGNSTLEPERSHNGNIEVLFKSKPTRTHTWNLNVNGFIRAADNLITLLANDDFFNSFDNVFNATSVGVELTGRLTMMDTRFRFDSNATYQSFRNSSTEGAFIGFKGDRIPNRPYFFANGALNYRITSPLHVSDQLNFFANTRYVHSFFRTWESAGIRQFASKVPAQNTYGLGATYEFISSKLRTRWALTAEIQNLTNARVFDFFGAQRPGRAYYIKITTQL